MGLDRAPRVLLVTKGLDLGGIERIVVDLAVGLRRRDLDVEVAVVNPDRNQLQHHLDDAGVPVHSLGGTDRIGIAAARELRRLIRTQAFDVVHAHGPLPAVLCRLSATGPTARRHHRSHPVDVAPPRLTSGVARHRPARRHHGRRVGRRRRVAAHSPQRDRPAPRRRPRPDRDSPPRRPPSEPTPTASSPSPSPATATPRTTPTCSGRSGSLATRAPHSASSPSARGPHSTTTADSPRTSASATSSPSNRRPTTCSPGWPPPTYSSSPATTKANRWW